MQPIDYVQFEKERHECEVRYVLRMRVESRERALNYLKGVEEKRPRGIDKLRKDVIEQWKLGNRGVHGDWRSIESSGKDRSEISSEKPSQNTS